MRLIGLATSGRPSLISGRTWNPPNRQRSTRASSSTCKRRTIPTRLLSRPTGTYNVEKIRRERPENITASEWEKYIEFWNDPRNIARAAQNRQNRAKSTVISRQGSRSLARLRDEMMQTSTTQEYPSLIDTFFVAHTVNGKFLRDEDRRIYEEMRRLEAMGTYTDDEINRLARGEKQRGHIAGVGRVLPAQATASPNMFLQFESGGASGSGRCRDEEEGADNQDDEDEDGDGDT
nr:F-box domain, leucine-rich repeat domain, L domain-like protein [Tanacetum cinerariifolium]